MEPAQRLLSLDDWLALDDDEDSRELIDGVLEEDELAGAVHEAVVAWLVVELGTWARSHDARVFPSGGRFVVGARRGRIPDAFVYLKGAKRPEARGLIRVPPSIMIEVVSPTPRDARRDRVEKLPDYAGFKVPYYWIVDPEARTIEILELGADGRYVHALDAVSGVPSPVPGCDGLALDIEALWADLDRVIAEGGGA